MPRVSRKPKLPPSRHPIERIRCSICGRSWAVYEGRTPRLWTVLRNKIFCDRRPCNAALELARSRSQDGAREPPRASRTPKLPPPRHPIQNIRCSICGRRWAVYQGKIPHMWTVVAKKVFCDRPACSAAVARVRPRVSS